MPMTCGHCKTPDMTVDHVRACSTLDHKVRGIAKLAAQRSLVVKLGAPAPTPVRLACESGPAGIGCDITGIPGIAATGWNGQRFTNMFECPRCHGKGYETNDDRRRNLRHDDFYMAKMIRGDF